jgi:heat shock protein HslJ
MKNGATKYFILLILLACNNKITSTKNTTTNTFDKVLENRKTTNLLNAGVDYYGEGNSPTNWTLQININDTVRFNSDDGLTLNFAYHQLKKEISTEKEIYSTKLKAGNIVIEKYITSCETSLEKKVTFTFNSITYKGCGKYLSNKKIEGKWILEKIENIDVSLADYNKIPEMFFDLEKNTVIGNDGCNSIKSTIGLEGKRIRFSNFTSTQRNCSKKNIASIIEKKISNRLVDYFFKDEKLYFYLIDDSILVFKHS